MRQCVVSARPLRPKRPGEPEPLAIYCSHRCRQAAYNERQRPRLDVGPFGPIGDRNALQMLRKAGVDRA